MCKASILLSKFSILKHRTNVSLVILVILLCIREILLHKGRFGRVKILIVIEITGTFKTSYESILKYT